MVFSTSTIHTVSARTTLFPNEVLRTQYIFSRSDPSYAPLDFSVYLEPGQWHVILSEISDILQVKITVVRGNNFTDIIAVSGIGFGNFPNVSFTLDESMDVSLRVEENSVNGTSYGAFDIGVFDSSHLSVLTTHTHSTPPQSRSLVLDTLIVTTGMAVILVFSMFVARSVKLGSSCDFTPVHIIQVQEQPATSDLSSSLPNCCPSCGLTIRPETIEWIDLHEARCCSCGSIIETAFSQT